jgi:anaerobic magnesium-protoporphyrin IX monomethyl ester cyclase
MRVLLVNPPIPDYFYNREFYFPSSLLSLGAVLREAGHEPRILDFKVFQRGEQDPSPAFYDETLCAAVLDFQPDLVGFGCLFSGNFPSVLHLSQCVKAIRPETTTLMGGIHATLYAADILDNCPTLDGLVLGEGEETILKIIDAMGRKTHWGAMGGVAFRDQGRTIVNPKTDYIHDVDRLPRPAYELIRPEDYFMDTSAWHNPRGLPIHTSVPILSSRSCPNRCTFCSMYKVMGPRWRPRSAANVVDEIEYVYHTYGLRHFSFMDDNVTLQKQRMIDICQGILDRGLNLQFETPNGIAINTIDAEVLDAMVSAGMVRTCLAIESGSDFIRNRIMKKHLSEEKIFEVLDLTRQYPQLFVNAFFLIGMPEETHATLEATYRMIERIRPDKTLVMNLVPFPGTEVFAQALRDDLLVGGEPQQLYRADDRYFTNYDQVFLKPYALEVDEIRAFRRRCQRLLDRQQHERMASMDVTEIRLSQGAPDVSHSLVQ